MLPENSAFIPFLIPFLGAILTLFFPKGRWLAVLLLISSFMYSIWLSIETYQGKIFVSYAGSWPAPYGIALAIDSLSSMMLLFSNLVFMLATFYGFTEEGHYYRLPLLFLLQAGVSLSFITADFFNLFVAFEILLTSSYVILLLESPKEERGKAFPYIMINIVGSFLFLTAAAMAYGATGNLNMAALHISLAENPGSPLVIGIAIVALIIYGLKAGLFPFYFWLPQAYPLLPYSLAGLFGGILTKVGVYVLIRLFVTVLPHELVAFHSVMLILAGLTMFLGVLGAMCQVRIKHILSYHILSQVGYMVLGLGVFTASSLAAALLFVVHNIIVKSSLFWIGGQAAVRGGGDELGSMRTLWKTAPLLGVCFLLQALSLAGVPPLSGFWGKYLLFSAAMESEYYLLLFFAALTSFWTLFSMVKIWLGAFWGEDQVTVKKPFGTWGITAIAASVVVSLCLGIGVETAYKFSLHAADEVLNPSNYVQAVLRGRE
ncbi:MAG: proton-conducting transporter membrane subunit [Parachlamydiaceae bacterium]